MNCKIGLLCSYADIVALLKKQQASNYKFMARWRMKPAFLIFTAISSKVDETTGTIMLSLASEHKLKLNHLST